jgi:hypothetical protein
VPDDDSADHEQHERRDLDHQTQRPPVRREHP